MADERCLIVNADDFGQSPGVNRGVILAHERGIVTSASLMVRWPAAAEAAGYARGRTGFSLGLHVDLCEWAYRHERWEPVYQVVPLDDRAAVAKEVDNQLTAFRRLVREDPTHIDSHQRVHRSEPVRSVLNAVTRQLAVPLRHFSRQVRHCGAFYGQTATGSPFPQGIGVERLLGILAGVPHGFTELGCHPGEGNDLVTMYRSERAEELKVLCDPRVKAALLAEGIELRSFRDVSQV